MLRTDPNSQTPEQDLLVFAQRYADLLFHKLLAEQAALNYAVIESLYQQRQGVLDLIQLWQNRSSP